MDTRVDWLAFTVPLPDHPYRTAVSQWYFVLRTVQKYTNSQSSLDDIRAGFEVTAASGFYKYRARHDKCGVTFSWGDINEHVFCEFSGVGCEWLRSVGTLDNLLSAVHERVSRIDIATDIETATTPREFVAFVSSQRFKTRSSVTSPTGDTEYIGSRSGERMARVYRYSPPHPRSHLLRVEVEYKGDSAKALASLLCRENLMKCSLQANAPFGWSHPAWEGGNIEAAKIPTRKHDREGAATLKWLADVVIPSLKRMEKEGYFDLREWVEENIFGA